MPNPICADRIRHDAGTAMTFAVYRTLGIRSEPGVYQSVGDDQTNFLLFYGAGSPEGVVAANVGSEFTDTTGGNKWFKATGVANTGWVQWLSEDSGGGFDLGDFTYTPLGSGAGQLSLAGNNVTLPLATVVDGGLLGPDGWFKLSSLSVTQAIDLDAVSAELTALRSTLGNTAGDVNIGAFAGTYVLATHTVGQALTALDQELSSLSDAVDILISNGEVDLTTIIAAISTLQTTVGGHTVDIDALDARVTAIEASGVTGTNYVVPDIAALPASAAQGDIYVAVDASADARVTSGAAGYIWHDGAFVLFGADDNAGGPGNDGVITITRNATSVTVAVDEASDVIPAATVTQAGVLTAADKFRINTLRSYTARIGDGVATQFDVPHNLGTVQVNVTVQHYPASGTPTYEVVHPKIYRYTNTVRLRFSLPPAANEYLVEVSRIPKSTAALIGA